MKKLKLYSGVLAVIIIAFANSANSQTSMTYKGNSITLQGGLLTGFTDIRSFDFKRITIDPASEIQFNVGASFNHMFNSVWGLRIGGTLGNLEGIASADSVVSEDNNIFHKLGFKEPVYFKTPIKSVNLSIYTDLSSLAMSLKKANQKPNSNRKFAMYNILGIGFVNFDSHIYSLKTDTLYNHYLHGKTGATNEMEFPIGFGAKAKLSHSLDLSVEGVMHNVYTDKLDAYVRDLSNNFKNNNDKYFALDLALTYKFVGSDPNSEYIEWMDPTEYMYDEYQMLSDKMKKMTTDSDNDGVADIFDKEQNTPTGNKVDGSGVSLDVDYDGVPDAKDKDLFTAKGATVNGDGVPNDADGDGVPDVMDKEPNTKAGSMVNFQGKTIPTTVNTPSTSGVGGTLPTIYFDTNMSTIKESYYSDLAGLAKMMKADPNMKIVCTGNADERASDSYNMSLGLKRAQAVKDFLVKYYGIDGNRIDVVSKGEANPLAKSFYSINRRVDIDIKK